MYKTHYLAGLQNLYVFFKNCVTVFLDEAVDLVLNVIGKMVNDKGCCRHPGFLEMCISPMFGVQFLTPVLVRSILQLNNNKYALVFHKLYRIKCVTENLQVFVVIQHVTS